MIDPSELMARAIEMTRQGIKAGQTPFGCAIASPQKILSVCHNVVWQTTDITAHAEVTAIRQACLATGKILLEGCVVATTCEPCPMCMAALHWARVDTVYYGATIADARSAGFNELSIAAAEILKQGGSPVKLVSGTMREECARLFDEWTQAAGREY